MKKLNVSSQYDTRRFITVYTYIEVKHLFVTKELYYGSNIGEIGGRGKLGGRKERAR